jgi:hypothetical protein
MRLGMLLSLAFALVLGLLSTSGVAAPINDSHGTTIVALQQPGGNLTQSPPSGKLDVDINVNHGSGGGRWYASPVWIAIGALAVIVIIALIVMAGRGGGTTIVRD